jgi:hypothetical protein
VNGVEEPPTNGTGPAGPGPAGAERRRTTGPPRLGTVLALVVVAATIGMWAYLFLVADPGIPDQLDDDAFPDEAQSVCAAAVERIEGLPPAQEAESPEERAVAVTEANQILTQMVTDLRAVAPTAGQDARLIRLWLEDWDTYLADRVEYAEGLAAGEDVELLVTARGAGQITVTLDHFAMVNDMLACSAPLDA